MLFISLAFPPAPSQAGVVCAKNAIALSEIGNEVDVLTCGIPFGVDWETGMQELFDGSNVRIIRPKERWWHHSSGRVRYYAEWIRYRMSRLVAFDVSLVHFPAILKTLRGVDLAKYDCVVTWSPFYSANLIGAWMKLRQPKLTWVAQFSDPWYLNPLQRRWLIRMYARIFEPATLRLCDGLVHNSRRAQRDLTSQWNCLKGKRLFVLRHGYIEGMYDRANPGLIREKDVFCMRFVGTLFGKRTPVPLFEALSRILAFHPEVHSKLTVSLVGPIDEEFLTHPSLQQLPDGLVRIEEPVPYLESLHLMRICDSLLLIEAPVVENRFVPSKLADYLGAGRPILALSRDAEVIEVVRGAGGIVADPENVEEIAEAIMAVFRGDISAPEKGNTTLQSSNSRVCAKELEDFLSLVKKEMSGADCP